MSTKNPLLDVVFLQELYKNRHKEIYAKIIALDKDENAIESIEGQVTGGSVSLDGSSNVRRSCNLTVVTHNIDINAYYWGFKNKFRLSIGLNNQINPEYDSIIWFPMGTYVITNFNTALSTNNYTINISGKDKMCLLNGDLSGSVFATIDFGKEEVYNRDTKITVINDIPIKTIVREAVHEYAGERWENIIINDLDDYGLELLDYKGSSPMFLLIKDNGSNEDLGDVAQITLDTSLFVTTVDTGVSMQITDPRIIYNPRNSLDMETGHIEPTHVRLGRDVTTGDTYTIAKIVYGQTCGYRYTDITYVGDLICNTGEPVTSMLDKLVAMLGNWEYFYDVDGRFVFQRKKTYLDKTWNTIVTNNDDSYIPTLGETYVESALWSSAVSWNFTDSFLVTAFNNTPVLNNVRNDYSIWGTRKSITGTELPVHLRYAIDKKPTYYVNSDGEVFVTKDYLNVLQEAAQEQNSNLLADPFRTHLTHGLDSRWWEVSDWARRYLYIADVNHLRPMGFYLHMTPDDIVTFINSYANENPYINLLKQKTLDNFWTQYITRDQLIEFFSDSQSLATIGPRQLFFLFDTKLNNQNEEYIAYVGHNPSSTTNTDVNTFHASCSHTYQDLLEDYTSRQYVHSYMFLPMFPQEATTEETQETITQLDLWDSTIVCDWREIIFQMAKDYRKHMHEDDFLINLRNRNGKDINGEWYYPNGKTGYEQYYTDLEGFWRQLYCPPKLLPTWYDTGVWTDRPQDGAHNYVVTDADKSEISYFMTSTNWVAEGDATKDGWNTQVIDEPSTINFWFDFLSPDTEADFAKYSVPAIGDRAKSVNDNNVKAIYFREIPNTIFTGDLAHTERKSGYTYMQYQPSMDRLFTVSSQGKCAIDVLEEWLNNYVYAVESVNMTAVPIYHLQPNTRIKVLDMNAHINGDYIVSRISIPLTYNGTMSITATKVADRVY